MSSESNDQEFCPADWVSAGEAIGRIRGATLSPRVAETLIKRANAKLLRSWARLVIVNGRRHENVEVPETFWWSNDPSLYRMNWTAGDFTSRPSYGVEIEALGLKFFLPQLRELFPSAFDAAVDLKNEVLAEVVSEARGRPMSTLWVEWVAEVAAYVHENGIPAHSLTIEGFTKAVADRLAERGVEAPGRSTVQDAARAVLRRLREAGK